MYMVRLSGSATDKYKEVRYSLAVKVSADRVQRFLISRTVVGYYMFGGRLFTS